MITHRDIAMPEFEKWLNSIDVLNKVILEIGPGKATEFRDRFEFNGGKWLGLDTSVATSQIYKGCMEQIPFPEKFFDYVFSCHAFEHTQHPLLTLQNIKNVCKKQFMLITPYHCQHQVLDGDLTHFFVLTDLQMKRLFRMLGIKEIKIEVQKNAELEQDWNLISIGDCS